MDLSKYNLDWENRYDILTIEFRIKIINDLKEPFKKRGIELKKIIDKHPRLIDENGNKTERLLITNENYINGHLIEYSSDEKGDYGIFQPNNRIENEKWLIVKNKIKLLSELSFKQNRLLESKIDISEIQKLKLEIDNLFTDIFDLKKSNIITEEKDYPKYCEIGSFFAQGFIYKKGFDVYFKKEVFENPNQLAKYLSNGILENKSKVRQYINDTLNENGCKNFYQSKKMMSNIIEYCNFKNIVISDAFQSKYNSLDKLH